jgi:hypothetical protein
MTVKRHIVLLTTWFPPLQSVAVNRMLAFVKYLDHDAFDISVITMGTDTVFGKGSEAGAEVYRIKPKSAWKPSFKPSDSKLLHKMKAAWRKLRMKFVKDEDQHWTKEAAAQLRSLHREKPVDVIISSFSPVAPHLVALEFVRQHATTRWIVDMRDEMSLNPQCDAAERARYVKIEAEINRYAVALTSVSDPIVAYFKQAIPDLQHYLAVRNGYDHEMPTGPTEPNKNFTILHAGSFYGIRKPTTFFKALERLHEKKLLPENWRFICAGASRNFSIPAAFKSNVGIIERVSQEESIKMMRSADVNLLVQPATGRLGVYTGKIFDYLSVRKPVLAVVDENDVAAALIRYLGAGYVADFDNVPQIEIALQQAIRDWKNKDQKQTDPAQIEALHRKFQVQKLNLLIETVLNEK